MERRPPPAPAVMINLFLNAADAMTSSSPAGGKGTSASRRHKALPPEEATEFMEAFPSGEERIPRRWITPCCGLGFSPPLLPGEILSLIRVEVEDTGPGIPQEALGKIFDPFYSTKPRRRDRSRPSHLPPNFGIPRGSHPGCRAKRGRGDIHGSTAVFASSRRGERRERGDEIGVLNSKPEARAPRAEQTPRPKNRMFRIRIFAV